MTRWMGKLASAGVWLGGLELLLVAALDHALFLSHWELARYGAFSLTLFPVLVMLLGALGAGLHRLLGSREARTLALTTSAMGVGFAALYWSLTSGRRVHDLPLRGLWVGLFALLSAAGFWALARFLGSRLRGIQGRRWALLVLAAGLVALVVDAAVLRRLYPPFHSALALAACLCGAFAAIGLPSLFHGSYQRQLGGWAFPAFLGLSVLQWVGLTSAPNARFAVEQAAPVSGKLLALSARLGPGSLALKEAHPYHFAPAGTEASAVLPAERLQLAERDVLLITVDALRADCLAAYGGSGLTPEMDGLSQQSLVFERAYTTAPHTSYAMASLMTGKYMREVLALPGETQPHATLAQTVRRYGYRTAAFYPPALFFVDEGAFADLSRAQFGFEYAKVMFAPAADRVEQLRVYLDELQEGHPLLVWVHLFEPHEPYEPDPQFARGDTPRERYEGEVAQADAAVGDLIRLFRARRGDDALIVLTADHGEEFRDHGGYRHGTTLFDEQVRVPLLMSAPPAIAPGRTALAVDHVDIPTTILAALGMPREARMRGDDLSGVLAGGAEPALHAFASVDDQRMVMDGQHKLICEGGRECRLYDLQQDPQERRDQARAKSKVAHRLASELARFAAGIAAREVLGVQGQALPEVLSRVSLGDRGAGAELLPLLGDSRSRVRALAAAACGESGLLAARQPLEKLRVHDPASQVRDEAALALYRLDALPSEIDAATLLGELKGEARASDFRRRVALALGKAGDRRAGPALLALAADTGCDEGMRGQAIEVLGTLGAAGKLPGAEQGLIPLLTEVRLRPVVASALGTLGSEPARRALLASLAEERYLESRVAEAQALAQQGDRRVVPLIRRFLATNSGLEGGIALLEQLSALEPDGGYLALESPDARPGFECGEKICSVGDGATLELRNRHGRRTQAMRWVVEAEAEADGAQLTVQGDTRRLQPGWQQVSFLLPADSTVLRISSANGVKLRRFIWLLPQQDIPPPPPEPWLPPTGAAPGAESDASPR